jgi:hemolysin III
MWVLTLAAAAVRVAWPTAPELVAGALSYHRRWPDPYPSVFGYHEVFHIYVCAAAACQYAAIARFIG